MDKYVDSRSSQSPVKVTIGKVHSLPAGSQPFVRNVGTVNDMILEFGLVQGAQGLTGATGVAVNGKDGRDGRDAVAVDGKDGRNGLTQEEIEAVVAKATAHAVAELKRAADQQIAAFKAKLDQAIKSL